MFKIISISEDAEFEVWLDNEFLATCYSHAQAERLVNLIKGDS
jgi:hypothetical protein